MDRCCAISYIRLLLDDCMLEIHQRRDHHNISADCDGRPKKCAQCVQCGPPITALRTEQDQKLATQCACHEAPTVSITHCHVNKRGWVSQTRTFSDCFAQFFTGLLSLKRLLHFFTLCTLFGLFIHGELYQAQIRFYCHLRIAV